MNIFGSSVGLDYSAPTRLGNWFEDAILEDERLRDFMEKKEKGELYLQRQNRLEQTLLSTVELGVTGDGFVRFGDVVMIRHRGMTGSQPYYPQVLAAGLGNDPLHLPSSLSVPSNQSVSAVPRLDPTVRTTFVVAALEDTSACVGRPLTYGEPFELRSTGGGLRLASNIRSFVEFSARMTQQTVKLVALSSRFTRWRVLDVSPRRSLEMEGYRVPANQSVVLNHLFTNKHLALEWRVPFHSVFGREYDVSAHTSFDVHKCPDESNQWSFFMLTRAAERPEHKYIPEEQEPSEYLKTLARHEGGPVHLRRSKPFDDSLKYDDQELFAAELPPAVEAKDEEEPGPPPDQPSLAALRHGSCAECLWNPK